MLTHWFKGYAYHSWDDVEEDNVKTRHYITPPGQEKGEAIDFSPYQGLSEWGFRLLVRFHLEWGRFPTRKDNNNACGPLHAVDLPYVCATIPKLTVQEYFNRRWAW